MWHLLGVSPDQIPAPSGSVHFVEPAFDPSRPPRTQLSAMSERLVEGVGPQGVPVRLGWVPERSPGGAFRLQVDAEERWFEGWDQARAALAAAFGGDR